MKRRERLYTCAVILALGAVTLNVRAEDQSTSIAENLGSHAYVIPRDLIEMIYKPDYSGVPNPNPNWPHDPVIRLDVQWPEFTASKFSALTGADRQDKAMRRIIISMSKRPARTTIAKIVERLEALHDEPKIIDAQYGLKELRSVCRETFENISQRRSSVQNI